MVRDPSEVVRLSLAAAPATPARVRVALIADPEEKIRQTVAGHPFTPMGDAELLASDSSAAVRQRLAARHGLSRATVELLSQDPSENVRFELARNPSTPADVLARLARDPSPTVRQLTAENIMTPTGVLETLAQDEAETVRGKVLWHANSTPEMRTQIMSMGTYPDHAYAAERMRTWMRGLQVTYLEDQERLASEGVQVSKNVETDESDVGADEPMSQQEVDTLLSHLVEILTEVSLGGVDEALAHGTLDAVAGDFLALHQSIMSSGSPIPSQWADAPARDD